MQSSRAIPHVWFAEEAEMNNVVRVKITDSEAFFPWKREALLSGSCRGVLPLGIIDAAGTKSILYRTEGFIKLSALTTVNSGDILTIVERILECVEICRDCLIFPGEYILSPDTVYLTENLNEARIAYIPTEHYVSEEGAISSLIYSMKGLTTENGRTYLDTLGTMLECTNLKLRRVIGFIEELKEEIRLCSIC